MLCRRPAAALRCSVRASVFSQMSTSNSTNRYHPLFAKERYKMAGTKTALTVDVNADHIGLISAAKEKYNIADEGKVVRIVMDYLVTNPGIHDTVFKDVRCLRCE